MVTRYKLEEAIRLAKRYNEIRSGHWWRPEGWEEWSIHVTVGQFDDDRVLADAVKITNGQVTETLNIGWRVEPKDLMSEVNSAISELRACRPDAQKGELEALPMPGNNERLLQLIQKDIAELCENEYAFSRARGLVRRVKGNGISTVSVTVHLASRKLDSALM